MNSLLASLSGLFGSKTTAATCAPVPEVLRPQPRPMTGFLATLSDEQRKAALDYRGPDGHGEVHA